MTQQKTNRIPNLQWCFVGYRRLSRAITAHKASNPEDTFSLHWKAFYLNPAAAAYPGVNKAEMYAQKFGAERMSAIFSRLAAVGEGEGIHFSFGGNTGSTRDSHRLLWYAGQQEAKMAKEKEEKQGVVGGVQSRVAEQLFRAYFEEEKNITDLKVLIEAAVRAGLDGEVVKKMLDEDVGAEEVDLEAKTAARRLVSGVPYISVQGKYHVEGADEPEAFLEIFEKVKREE
jgi:predicted DsbA family dithiol-disulfide isomerase